MQPPLSLPPNNIIHDRYRIVRMIGQGGMGAVYEAIDQRLGNTVALKQMIVSGQQFSLAFEREARLLASLRHPSLPKVMDFFTDNDQQFLVMEFIPGADLAALRKDRNQPFRVEEVLHWADQVLGALEFLHGQKPPIIHRDIKPQNLKVTPDGTIVLLDFGLAKGATAAFSEVATTSSIFGYTPMYAPIEQIQGTGTTAVSDIYSLSATLHHLLSDRPPVDVLARAGAVMGGNPDPLRPVHELNGAVDPAISAWLMPGLQIDGSKRYKSAAEMHAALHAIQHTATPAPLPPTFVVPSAQPVSLPQSNGPSFPQSTPLQPIPPFQSYGQLSTQQAHTLPTRRSLIPWLIGGGVAIIAVVAVLAVLALLLLRQPTRIAAFGDATTTAAPVVTATTENRASIATAETAVAEATSPPATAPAATPTNAPPLVEPTLEAQFGPLVDQRPARSSASNSAPSGTDSSGNSITYGPENAIDGALDTTWRVAGDGVNQFLQLDFAAPVRVREVLVLPGYAKTDPFDGTDRFTQNRRVRRALLAFSDGTSVEAQFADTRELQLVQVPPVVTTYVRIVILETTAPAAQNGRDFTPISEVVVRGEAQQDGG